MVIRFRLHLRVHCQLLQNYDCTVAAPKGIHVGYASTIRASALHTEVFLLKIIYVMHLVLSHICICML